MSPKQATPVKEPITLIIRKERKTSTSPIMAKVKVLRAPSTALESPPENSSWYPAKIIINRATVPASPIAQVIRLAIIGKIQSKVATPLLHNHPYSKNNKARLKKQARARGEVKALVVELNGWDGKVA